MHSSRIKKKVKDDYDEIASSFSKTRNSAWAEFEFFSPFYKSSSKVLDLGCGNGRLYDYLKKFGFKSYLGVDQSKNLINEARKHHSKAKFQVVDMAKLNGLKGEYDALFAIASFHHLAPSEQLQTLKKWRSH
jgi:trans-aconitate methyltransferase